MSLPSFVLPWVVSLSGLLQPAAGPDPVSGPALETSSGTQDLIEDLRKDQLPAAAGTTQGVSVPPDVVLLTPSELDDLLGPIALYPDPLIAQILAASVYPLEIVQAARWVKDHPNLAGLEGQPWDPSVVAIARYSSVLALLDKDLDWTMRLGRAFLYQQGDVMDAVQRLRVRARDVGSLVDTPQQVVVVQESVVRIIPAQPEVIYVPTYDPVYVYVRPSFPCHPSSFVTFSRGFSLGIWFDLDCDWRHRYVRYHRWHDHHEHHWCVDFHGYPDHSWHNRSWPDHDRHDGRGDWRDGDRHDDRGRGDRRDGDGRDGDRRAGGGRPDRIDGEAWQRDERHGPGPTRFVSTAGDQQRANERRLAAEKGSGTRSQDALNAELARKRAAGDFDSRRPGSFAQQDGRSQASGKGDADRPRGISNPAGNPKAESPRAFVPSSPRPSAPQMNSPDRTATAKPEAPKSTGRAPDAPAGGRQPARFVPSQNTRGASTPTPPPSFRMTNSRGQSSATQPARSDADRAGAPSRFNNGGPSSTGMSSTGMSSGVSSGVSRADTERSRTASPKFVPSTPRTTEAPRSTPSPAFKQAPTESRPSSPSRFTPSSRPAETPRASAPAPKVEAPRPAPSQPPRFTPSTPRSAPSAAPAPRPEPQGRLERTQQERSERGNSSRNSRGKGK